MAALEFNNYRVDKLSYVRNKSFKKKSQTINLSPKISTNFDIKENKILLSLNVVIGSTEDKKVPFQAECYLTGIFIYHHEEDKAESGIDEFIQNNAVAILYPYVRELISNLTKDSNEFSTYILPTINVADILKKSGH